MCLSAAIDDNDLERVRVLLEEHHLDPNFIGEDGGTYLSTAVIHLDEDWECDKPILKKIIRVLLRYCAETINLQDNNGWTALMEACWGGYTEIVKLLLENGAAKGINLQSSNHGETALMMAAGFHILYSSYQMIKLLLRYGADASIQDKDGKTVFDRRIFRISIQVCKLHVESIIYPVWYQRYDLMENDLPLLHYFHLLPRELVEMIFEWI